MIFFQKNRSLFDHDFEQLQDFFEQCSSDMVFLTKDGKVISIVSKIKTDENTIDLYLSAGYVLRLTAANTKLQRMTIGESTAALRVLLKVHEQATKRVEFIVCHSKALQTKQTIQITRSDESPLCEMDLANLDIRTDGTVRVHYEKDSTKYTIDPEGKYLMHIGACLCLKVSQ